MFVSRTSVGLPRGLHLSLRRNYVSATSAALSPNRFNPPSSQFFRLKPDQYYTVTLIPGDGVGAEIAAAVRTVFESAGCPIKFEEVNVSGEKLEDPDSVKKAVESLNRNGIGLKGTLFTPHTAQGHSSFNVAIRKQLGLYANVSVVKNIPGVVTRHSHLNLNMILIRENTEGEYSGLESSPTPGVVESFKIITREASERIAKFAFDFCVKHDRKKVTVIHKANIMKQADGLFLKSCENVAKNYVETGIKLDNMIVDNACMQLVGKPEQFDVLLAPNLYGNILSNIAAALVGGPGVMPGFNIGKDIALFEPGARHIAKDITGQNVANPTAMLLSATLMLRHLGLEEYASRIHRAVHEALRQGGCSTPDIAGGKASTTEFTKKVIANLD